MVADVEVNEFGPVQLYVAPGVADEAVKLNVEPRQTGELPEIDGVEVACTVTV